MLWIQLAMVVGFAVVHLFGERLRFLEGVPRSIWLSFAGGVSVAYVFVHIFPELAEIQAETNRSVSGFWQNLEHHAYLIALLGLGLFYGLERYIKTTQCQQHAVPGPEAGETTSTPAGFRLHILSFSLYNALIAYLLVHREEQGLISLLFYFCAMSLHLLVNDFGLRQDHKTTYHHHGRWILATAVIAGWLLGRFTDIDEMAIGGLFAFLAGGTILNVMKEELPEERKSRFWPFTAGVVLYSLLLTAAG